MTGTPTDCVMMATTHLMKDDMPTLVLSGVNRGVNAADDVTYSGTIAGAMEGCALGIPSIALSQVYNFEAGREMQWDCAETHGPAVLRKLIDIGWPQDVLFNVNFPGIASRPGRGRRSRGTGQARSAGSGDRPSRRYARLPYFWIGFRRERTSAKPGTDLGALAANKISVTPLHLNLTETEVLETLKQQMDSTLPLREGQSAKRFGEG